MSNIKLTTGSLTEALKKSGANTRNNNDQMWKNFLTPKPTPEGSYYRMRLLWFVDENSNRNIPFIEQYNHTVYDRDENGKLTVDFVTCPTSPYLNIKNAWQSCPICQYANNQFELAKSTNFTNKVASANHRKMRRQFVAFIPAYIISDPNVPENNGRVMLFLIRDRDTYKRLCEQVKGKEHELPVFNGEGAVDLAVVVQDVPQKNKDGSERINQYTGQPYTRKELKFQFGSKAHDIEIPVSQIEAIDFDSLYSYSSEIELKAFLAKHTTPVDVPEDDFDITISEDTPTVDVTTTTTKDDIVEMGSTDEADTNDIDIDDIDISDVNSNTDEVTETKEVEEEKKENLVTNEINVDDVLADIPDIDDLF
jgi:hypothetical protein